ncbi:hypothetical protein MGG_16344 [Pyricularia oryzae 70-15]|uniref:Uncharacterized protein n=1 Tax=Pyricularia oryzae (strain 70-15 / ATCC MYA-4617 / FGSC 8958) TaxID=242507 RepID=G4ML99_PYRO7|nr:uncharacterized protein MGG_16344 [Pyricularia oryzae 70-15]EHA57629.1 hypothetical protein MGG_16344 [Pyricularia oryzae 70-15]
MLRRRQVPGYRLNSILQRNPSPSTPCGQPEDLGTEVYPILPYHHKRTAPVDPQESGCLLSTAPPRMNHFNIRYPRGTSRTGIVLASACY